MTKKIALYGAYTLNNFGDDIFFYIFTKFLRDKYKNVEIDLISFNYKNRYENVCLKVRYVYSKNIFGIIKTIFNNSIIVIGPGSIFGDQNKYIIQNLYILFLSFFAKLFFKKIIFLGIDIPKTDSFILNFSSNFSLLLADKIYLRFSNNLSYINNKFYFIKNKIHLISDVVYSDLFTSLLNIDNIKANNDDILIVFSDLRHLPNYKYIEQFFINTLKKISSKGFHYKIVSLNMSFKGNKDLDYINYLISKYNLKISNNKIIYYDKWNIANLSKFYNLVLSSKLLLSNKLHSSIVGSIAGINIFSLNYHSKMHYLNDLIGLKDIFEFELFIDELDHDIIDKYSFKMKRILNDLNTLSYDKQSVKDIIKSNNLFFSNLDI
ncbi:MAG: polysaccharide pyruvyl transferase family protein [Candidatus Gracilibacteria bacterium]